MVVGVLFLLISAAGSGSYILLGWLFSVLLRQSGWMAVLFGFLLVVGSALYIAVASVLVEHPIPGAIFFACGVLGYLAASAWPASSPRIVRVSRP